MKTIKVYDRHFQLDYRDMELTFGQFMKLKILGEVEVFTGRPPAWTGEPGSVPFYVASCNEHGYYLDNKHGNKECTWCPFCLERTMEEKPWERREYEHEANPT